MARVRTNLKVQKFISTTVGNSLATRTCMDAILYHNLIEDSQLKSLEQSKIKCIYLCI